ncbi:MAG TPA: hypothetical protein PLD10_26000 [Rhodopila sp.]|nr:hypothetical protein [Rhodopila sp.]
MTPFLIDLDDVCFDWLTTFKGYAARVGLKFVPGNEHNYDLVDSFPNNDPELVYRHLRAFNHMTDYFYMEPRAGATDVLFALRNEFPNSLFIAVSSCGTDSITARARRYQTRHLPLDSMILLPMGQGKANVYRQFTKGYVIEDGPQNLRAATQAGHYAICFDAPYNRHVEAPLRITAWSELHGILTAGTFPGQPART